MKPFPRAFYRVWQFWQTLTGTLSPNDWREVKLVLTLNELPLFERMNRADQAHSFRVMKSLQAGGHTDPNLLIAALLHDTGKGLHPLRFWERPVPVLAKGLLREDVHSPGNGNLHGWRRPLIIAKEHPAWGSEMAARAGSSPLTVWLIRHHQDENPPPIDHPAAERFLTYLKKADNKN